MARVHRGSPPLPARPGTDRAHRHTAAKLETAERLGKFGASAPADDAAVIVQAAHVPVVVTDGLDDGEAVEPEDDLRLATARLPCGHRRTRVPAGASTLLYCTGSGGRWRPKRSCRSRGMMRVGCPWSPRKYAALGGCCMGVSNPRYEPWSGKHSADCWDLCSAGRSVTYIR